MDALQQAPAVNVQVVNQSVRQILVRVDVIPMLAVNYQVGAEVLILVEDVIIAKSEQIVVLEELLVALVLAEVPIVVLVMPHLTSAKIILNIKNSPLRPLKGEFSCYALYLYYTHLLGGDNRLGAIGYTDGAQQGIDMQLHRCFRHTHFIGYLLVGQALGYEL